MKFYRLDEVPKSSEDRVFKESPVINAIAAVILFGLAGGAIYLGIIKWQPSSGRMDPFAPYIVGGILAVVGLFPLFTLRASLKPTNWLMRCSLSGIVVNLRGYENWRMPTDTEEAVGIEHGEIAWAKLVKETRKSQDVDARGQRGTVVQLLTYIDLGLANPDTSKLEAMIDAVRNRRPKGMLITLDYPVRVQPGGIMEIRWGGGIRPSAKEALKVLSQRVKILETEHRKTDLTYQPGGDPEADKAKIIELAKSGDEMGAAALAQRVYRCSLSDATNMVDKWLGQEDD